MMPTMRRERRYSAWLLALIAASLVPIAIGLATATRRTPDVDAPLESSEPPNPPSLAARTVASLPAALQDASAAPVGAGSAALLGGLDAANSSRPTVQVLSAGRAKTLGNLPTPLHDAAAVTLNQFVYLFGGGQSASYSGIYRVNPRTGQARSAGQLPEPRSDLGAATIDGTAYLVGGFTGLVPLRTILAWTPAAGPHVVGQLPQPLRYAAVAAVGHRLVIAGGETPDGPTARVLSFDPANGRSTTLGSLPQPVSHAAAATLGGDVYVLGGRGADGAPMRVIVAIDPRTALTEPAGALPQPLSDEAAVGFSKTILVVGGRTAGGPTARVLQLAPQIANPTPLLRIGSDPRALPGDVLIADKANNRLLLVSPEGQIVWSFPRPGDLAKGQTFMVPDDAFYTYDGGQIVATEEDNYVISVIDVGSGKITYRYGHPGVPGSSAGYVYNPDDAIPLRNGNIVAADIKNCRLIELRPPAQQPVRQVGATGGCVHQPPTAFSSPNGAFPMANGGSVVTEIGGVWVDILSRSGKLVHAISPSGFSYPSDTNEVRPGVYLSVDYASPGTIMEFDQSGHVLWRFSPRGPDALNHPSLALPLPNGDVLANDDYNDRVIVVDPRTNHIVWQYGHTGAPGTAPGYLNNPDGVDLAPPYALVDRFPASTGLPGG
jgi:outer membrane protein assembly factor BamB